MKKIFFLLCLSLALCNYVSAQTETFKINKSDAFSTLTDNDGYWLLYSETTEQLRNGEYLALDTFFDNDDVSSIMIEENGVFNAVDSDYRQSQVKWELTDNLEIKIINEDPTDFYDLEIIELKEPFLSVRSYHVVEDANLYKISRYCRPGYRLSSDEVESRNNIGAYEIEGFSKNQLKK